MASSIALRETKRLGRVGIAASVASLVLLLLPAGAAHVLSAAGALVVVALVLGLRALKGNGRRLGIAALVISGVDVVLWVAVFSAVHSATGHS
jgi:hypothetical protein